MDNQMNQNFQSSSIPQQSNMAIPQSNFTTQNIIIIILSILLIFSFLGISLLDIFSNIIKAITRFFGPIVGNFLSLIGYTTGTVLNASADVVSDTSKLAIDIAEGSIQEIGNLMIKASKQGTNSSTLSNDLALKTNPDVPTRDSPENPIQKPISSSKSNWCLVGEFDGKRSCVEMKDYEKCMSGKIFESKEKCVNIK